MAAGVMEFQPEPVPLARDASGRLMVIGLGCRWTRSWPRSREATPRSRRGRGMIYLVDKSVLARRHLAPVNAALRSRLSALASATPRHWRSAGRRAMPTTSTR